jgi:cell division protein FtsN
MSTPIGRDFKRTRKSDGLDLDLSRDFFVGLALGLAIAVGVFAWQQKEMQQRIDALQNPPRPEPRVDNSSIDTTSDASADEENIPDYGFYDMLPNSEVVINDLNQRGSAAPPPNVPIERPGSYVLQPGAYRDRAEAERVQAKLSRLGITAIIQRVAVENDEFHRVRIGPISDLKTLNRTRSVLRSADIDALLIRVGD